MVKNEMVIALSDMGYFKNQAHDVIDDVFQVISEALVNEGKVTIRGFGTFEVKTRKGCLCNDITTQERVMRDDYKVIQFHPGNLLKSAVKTGDLSKLKSSRTKNEQDGKSYEV